jgi:hypothetical protein
MEWDVNYAGLDVGFDYRLFNKKASVYIKAGCQLQFWFKELKHSIIM